MQASSQNSLQNAADPAVQTFEAALEARAQAMADACTRCGKCVEVCPATAPAGVTAEPRQVIDGVLDILRYGEGNEAAANGLYNEVEAFNPATNSWKRFEPMPLPRHSLVTAAIGNRIYLPGGATLVIPDAIASMVKIVEQRVPDYHTIKDRCARQRKITAETPYVFAYAATK